MARFKVTWPTNLVSEYEQSDCHTVEQFVNCRFGAGVELDAKIEILGEKTEVAPEVAPEAAPEAAPKTVAKAAVKPAK